MAPKSLESRNAKSVIFERIGVARLERLGRNVSRSDTVVAAARLVLVQQEASSPKPPLLALRVVIKRVRLNHSVQAWLCD